MSYATASSMNILPKVIKTNDPEIGKLLIRPCKQTLLGSHWKESGSYRLTILDRHPSVAHNAHTFNGFEFCNSGSMVNFSVHSSIFAYLGLPGVATDEP